MNLLVPLFIIGTLIFANFSIKSPSTKNDVQGASDIKVSPSTSPSITSSQKTQITSTIDNSNVRIQITQSPNNLESEQIIYPNSISIGESTYESTDNPQSITEWYKKFIKDKNMNTTSVVSTNTNGNIKNVLVANNGTQKLHVEILKNNNDSKTIIRIE